MAKDGGRNSTKIRKNNRKLKTKSNPPKKTNKKKNAVGGTFSTVGRHVKQKSKNNVQTEKKKAANGNKNKKTNKMSYKKNKRGQGRRKSQKILVSRGGIRL